MPYLTSSALTRIINIFFSIRSAFISWAVFAIEFHFRKFDWLWVYLFTIARILLLLHFAHSVIYTAIVRVTQGTFDIFASRWNLTEHVNPLCVNAVWNWVTLLGGMGRVCFLYQQRLGERDWIVIWLDVRNLIALLHSVFAHCEIISSTRTIKTLLQRLYSLQNVCIPILIGLWVDISFDLDVHMLGSWGHFLRRLL